MLSRANLPCLVKQALYICRALSREKLHKYDAGSKQYLVQVSSPHLQVVKRVYDQT